MKILFTIDKAMLFYINERKKENHRNAFSDCF